MKQTFTKKIFTLLITSISFFAMGCGEGNESQVIIENAAGQHVAMRIVLLEDNMGITYPNTDPDSDNPPGVIQGLSITNLNLPKVNVKMNGSEHEIDLKKEKFTFPTALEIGQTFGITMDESYYQFTAITDGLSDPQFEPIYEMSCQLKAANGVVEIDADEALLICKISMLPFIEIEIDPNP